MKKWDALTFFTLLWSQVSLLQCIKYWNNYQISSTITTDRLLCFILLGSAACATNCYPNNSAFLLLLCTVHCFSLVLHGSISNHVIVAIAVAFSCICSYSSNRDKYKNNFGGAILRLLIALYLVPGFHKLNNDWFNVKGNCATLYAASTISTLLNLPTENSQMFEILAKFIQSAPYQAIFIEFGLPFMLILSSSFVLKEKWTWRLFQTFVIIGSIFHLALCYPLPPLSVYPFSMLMIPMFAILLPQNAIDAIQSYVNNMMVLSCMVGGIVLFYSFILPTILEGEDMPLEYPPYGLWTHAIIWNTIIWILINCGVLFTTPPKNGTMWLSNLKNKPLNNLILMGFIAVGMSPYFGIRTYPALAMFSNLRVEGNPLQDNNHLVINYLQSMNISTQSIDVMQYLQTYVTIHETNLHGLQYFQVDIGKFALNKSIRFNEAFGISNEFWISPPIWDASSYTKTNLTTTDLGHMKAYSIPFIEMRRVVSKAIKNEFASFFVLFTYHDELNNYSEFTKYKLCYSNGKFNKDCHSSNDQPAPGSIIERLNQPLSWFEKYFVRFRSFDVNYSPCRH